MICGIIFRSYFPVKVMWFWSAIFFSSNLMEVFVHLRIKVATLSLCASLTPPYGLVLMLLRVK